MCATSKIFPIGLGLFSLTVSFNTLLYTHVKLKGKILLVYFMKFYCKGRFLAPFILKFSVSVVITQVTTRTLYLRRNIRKYPLTRRLGGPQNYSWHLGVRINLSHLLKIGRRFLTCPLQPCQCADGATSDSTRH